MYVYIYIILSIYLYNSVYIYTYLYACIMCIYIYIHIARFLIGTWEHGHMFLFLIGALRTEKVLLMVVRDVCPIDPTVFFTFMISP